MAPTLAKTAQGWGSPSWNGAGKEQERSGGPPAHGIPIRRLLTDNGSCYRSRQFRAACLRLGIQHRFTRPYTPRTNGKAERFIQTALREWAYVRHYLNSEERDQQLSPWLEHYNFHRPHGSLGDPPPISRAAPLGTTS